MTLVKDQRLKVCSECKVGQERTEFYGDKHAYDKLAQRCKPCDRARLKRLRENALERKRQERLNPPDPLTTITRLHGNQRPHEPSFKDLLVAEANKHKTKLVEAFVKDALGGNPQARQRLMEYLIGKPDVIREDSGSERFGALIMAAIAARAGGEAPELESAESDPGDGGLYPDPGSGSSACGPESPGGGSDPEASDGWDSSGEILPDRSGDF